LLRYSSWHFFRELLLITTCRREETFQPNYPVANQGVPYRVESVTAQLVLCCAIARIALTPCHRGAALTLITSKFVMNWGETDVNSMRLPASYLHGC
jgi:hypothetical protein